MGPAMARPAMARPAMAWAMLALVVSSDAAAARAPAPRGQAYAVVVPASSPQEAKDRLTALVDVYVYARILGYEDVPRVFGPGELALDEKGDGWGVVFSFCGKKDAAARAAALRDRVDGAAVKKLARPAPGTCLNRRAFLPISDQERQYVKAIVDDPKNANARVFYAGFLQSETRFAEAERVLEKALEIDPNNEQAKNLLRMSKLMGGF